MQWQKDEFVISTDPARIDIPYVHAFLSTKSYWAGGVPIEIVRASINGSLCFGMYAGERQVGFTRVITDKATFGYLADVFIDEGYRGRGLSKWMMETILGHPELQGFRIWQLSTRDAHGLYEQFGFEVPADPRRIMRRNDPDIYRRSPE
ncbi:MAG: GNAT family N-acetyltransferase [Bacteroidota bacterium]|nr:GNAT family N-acetyltransferase [Bacteroidota bacterium]MDP4216166.1 GNAT family N-acetyltransferase [Bacteroidota bacterium]MDP4246465.1 GNAT family N-acetyltransferase [Bacteroidota bacterium]MDP4255226.1 GNAT family N-acetyltransferase [Bacteroidota bacterium]MDP4258342.1 GNAT family N-acetyltransferase [Bacteroidota bacterium]